MAPKCTIDIFGDLNVAFGKVATGNGNKTTEIVKIGYDGKIKNHTSNDFNLNNIEGITPYAISSDNSGDMHVYGQTSWNRNSLYSRSLLAKQLILQDTIHQHS